MKHFDMSRFKNVGLWVSLVSLVPLITNLFGYTIVPDEFNNVVNTVLSLLVGLGILSNPTTDCKWFLDDNKEVISIDSTDSKE